MPEYDFVPEALNPELFEAIETLHSLERYLQGRINGYAELELVTNDEETEKRQNIQKVATIVDRYIRSEYGTGFSLLVKKELLKILDKKILEILELSQTEGNLSKEIQTKLLIYRAIKEKLKEI